MQFLKENQEIYTVNTLSMIAEYSNAAREKNSAYYTDKMLLHNIYSILPEFENYKKISVLEPSVGVGSFLPLIAKKYSHVDEIIIDCIDLSEEAIDILEFMVKLYDLGDNVRLNYIVNDFLKHEMDYRYDLIIGNPPFSKMTIKKKEVANDFVNYKSKNLSSYFLEKSLKNADYVVMIMPKNLLNTTEFNETRDYISQFRINNIVDFGEYGFKGVLVETICLSIDTTKKPNKTLVSSLPMDISKIQNQSYVTSNKFPYWIIYRNDYFDNFVNNLELNVFEVFRDRQLTNANMKATTNDKVRVIKSRNITDDGKLLI